MQSRLCSVQSLSLVHTTHNKIKKKKKKGGGGVEGGGDYYITKHEIN